MDVRVEHRRAQAGVSERLLHKSDVRGLGQVRERRKALGWSQEMLAEKAELDRTYIGRCEAGKQNATLKTVYLLADALGVEAKDLLPPMGEVGRKQP